MEITTFKTMLTAAKPWMQKGRRGGLETTRMARIRADGDGVLVTCTDLDTSVTIQSTEVMGETFDLCVDPVALIKIIGKRAGEISLKDVDGRLVVGVGKRTVEMNAEPGVDQPSHSDDYQPTTSLFSWHALLEAANYASGDDSRPILTGVHIDGEGAVSGTNSYHLTKIWGAAQEDNEMLIPATWVKKLLKLGPADNWVKQSVCGRELTATGSLKKFPDLTFTSSTRLIEGNFPDVDGLIPDTSEDDTNSWFKVTDALVLSVKEIVGIGSGEAPVRIFGTDDGVKVHFKEQDKFLIEDEVTTAAKMGAADGVAFNADYLHQMLIPGATVQGPNLLKPWIQRDLLLNDLPRVRLIMPVRVT